MTPPTLDDATPDDATPDDWHLAVTADTPADEVVVAVKAWIDEFVPVAWRDAADRGGAAAIRAVRSRADYEAWYPVFGRSGLVAPTWAPEYGGLGLEPAVARLADAELAKYNLGRLNPLGLNNAAAAIIAYGTEEQKQRFLPPIVRNEEIWCQLFSEPGAGSDLASLACRAVLDGDEWIVSGQKVWTTWGFAADFGILIARTNPDVGKRQGITYFLVDMHQPGVDVRELRHITGEVDFCEVFLDGARVPDFNRLGDVDDGWRVASATLSGERQMVAGAGSGGVDRIGGSGVTRLIRLARDISAQGRNGGWDDPMVRDELMRLYSEERIRSFTNQRVRAQLKAGKAPGPESSIGKVAGASLNQRVQLAAAGLLGPAAGAWESEHATEPGAEAYGASLPFEVEGMLRSRANSIEGGTTEVNKNILGERVLGLPREPDPYRDAAWKDTPRS